MRPNPACWLATLRTRKRALLWALLPAFTLAAAAGPACTATAAAPHVGSAVHEHGGAHEQHGAAHAHGDATAHAPENPSAPCPHCPLEAGGANLGHATCTIANGHDGGAAPAQSAPHELPPVLVRDWTLPAARAAPPLIATPAGAERSPPPKLPLHLVHCILVI
jgi:hypothetical protein